MDTRRLHAFGLYGHGYAVNLWLLGCTADPMHIGVEPGPPPTTEHETPPITTPPTVDTPPDDTADPTDTSPPTVTTLPPVDCATVSTEPLSITELGAPRGYHGLAITDDGRIIGSDNANLVAVTYDDVFTVLSTGFGVVQQMDWIDGGDLAIAVESNDAIMRLDIETGAQSVIASGVSAYGVVYGPDGKIWTANDDKIHRIDPVTGEKETLYNGGAFAPHALGFDVGYSRLLMSTTSGGTVWAWDLDATYEPVDIPYHFAEDVGGWQDCVVVDACGTVYVCDFSSSSLYRVSADGQQVGKFVNWTGDTYGHGAIFGNGVGGWRRDALYLPQPYDDNTVAEVVIGVGSAHAD